MDALSERLRRFEGWTVIFDLDGTLVHTAPDLTASLNHALAGHNLAPVEMRAIYPMLGQGARKMVERGLTYHDQPFDTALVDRLTDRFIEYYAENIAHESRPFDGCVPFLDAAHAAGLKLAVCTNKIESMASLLIRTLDLEDRFASLIGGDTLPTKKPDAAPLIAAVERAGGTMPKAVMIGDSAADIDGAKAAGLPSVAVSFGYSEVPVSELGADAVIDHYNALAAALEALIPSAG
ncbi:MAG: phosphoglycolate phosphatase [Pseudomonadota bacterium]